jgi:hypothetical protein
MSEFKEDLIGKRHETIIAVFDLLNKTKILNLNIGKVEDALMKKEEEENVSLKMFYLFLNYYLKYAMFLQVRNQNMQELRETMNQNLVKDQSTANKQR